MLEPSLQQREHSRNSSTSLALPAGPSATLPLEMHVCLLSASVVSDPVDCSLPGSSVHGILQARTLEWVAISVSRGSF